MKYISVILISFLSPFIAAHADETQHYQAAKVANIGQAISILKDADTTIVKTLTMPTITPSEYENIHQISYNMEEALEVIKNDENYSKADTKSLSHAIHDIHEASEDYKKAGLSKASKQYSAVLKTTLSQ